MIAHDNNSNDALNFENWLTHDIGVSNDCYEKLKSYGCNSISILKACTESDIEDISHDINIKKIDKLKLKVAIKKINECDNNKHLIIEMEERNIMINIDNKIKEFEQILNTIDTNHIILESKKCEKQINDTFDTLYNSLKKRQKILLNKLNAICNNKKNEIIKNKQIINEYLSKSMQIKQECHKLLNKPTTIEQLNDRKHKLGQKAHKVIGIKYNYNYNNANLRGEIVTFKSYLNSLLKIHNKFGDIYGIKYINSDEWDMNEKGNNILINNKICISNIDNEYQSVFGCMKAIKGIHHWRLKIIKTTFHMLWNTIIGILQLNKDNNHNNKIKNKNTYFTEHGHSFAFIGNCGVLEPNINNNNNRNKNNSDNDNDDDDELQTKYGEILKNGSIIDVILDCNKHTLKYHINNKDYGFAFQHIPQGQYCLAVTMTQKNDTIQLISYSGQEYC